MFFARSQAIRARATLEILSTDDLGARVEERQCVSVVRCRMASAERNEAQKHQHPDEPTSTHAADRSTGSRGDTTCHVTPFARSRGGTSRGCCQARPRSSWLEALRSRWRSSAVAVGVRRASRYRAPRRHRAHRLRRRIRSYRAPRRRRASCPRRKDVNHSQPRRY